MFDIQEDTKGSNNPWTRCKPNVQKSIKSTMKPKCLSVHAWAGHKPSVPTPLNPQPLPTCYRGKPTGRPNAMRDLNKYPKSDETNDPIGNSSLRDNNQHLKHISKQASKSHQPSWIFLAGAALFKQSPCITAFVGAPLVNHSVGILKTCLIFVLLVKTKNYTKLVLRATLGDWVLALPLDTWQRHCQPPTPRDTH